LNADTKPRMNPAAAGTPPSATFFERIAHTILARHRDALPDLRRIVVLLPNHHAIQPLAQALVQIAHVPALLLPRMTTLQAWAESVPLDAPLIPDSRRAAALYQALRERRWFTDADLWGITRELLSLMDDLTQHAVTLPATEEDFIAQLEAAYQARRNAPLQFEARVVHELWYAMSASSEMDAARAYQSRLAALVEEAAAPLFALATSDLSAPEERFFEAYAKQAPVTRFDLRQMILEAPDCAALSTLLPDDAGIALREQAGTLYAHHPDAALNSRHCVRLFGAHSLEEEARAADTQVRRWLIEGRKEIALVAQDRITARRVRALLERAGVLVQDETGWTFSTLSVSTVVMRWLDALQSDFYHEDLLDLFKSPFIFADQQENWRKQAVFQLEELIRRHSIAQNLDAFLELTADAPEAQAALVRLQNAAQLLEKNSSPLAGWLAALHQSLNGLGVLQGLERDAAGVDLLRSLQLWREELQEDATRFSRTEWRHWLMQQLDANTFGDASIESPVLLTSLAATRWRSFDGVILLGADAAHLPSLESNGTWFNDAVRAALGLPTTQTCLNRQRDDLLGLLALNGSILATWQKTQKGEENLLSPYLEMLRAVHQLAYGDDLEDRELRGLIGRAEVGTTPYPLPHPASMPAPAIPPAAVPRRFSANSYNSLVACPYQFYARYLLQLNELDEVQEGVEKRDYGDLLHRVLHRFHEKYPVLSSLPRPALEDALYNLSREGFAHLIGLDYSAHAWLMRWFRMIPDYLDKQLSAERDGWRYFGGEIAFEVPLADDLALHGRIDRLDAKDGTLRVLDYKTSNASALKGKLKEAGEDVQLAAYAYAKRAESAAFVAIDRDEVAEIAPPHDLNWLAKANAERLIAVAEALRAGAPLPAHGIDSACDHCEMRGLCRKNDWETQNGL
jgi:ATP-dependent helicase/nuclease subunit B